MTTPLPGACGGGHCPRPPPGGGVVVLWGTAGEGEEAAVRKHGSAWIMQATAAPGGPGTQGSHGHAGGW